MLCMYNVFNFPPKFVSICTCTIAHMHCFCQSVERTFCSFLSFLSFWASLCQVFGSEKLPFHLSIWIRWILNEPRAPHWFLLRTGKHLFYKRDRQHDKTSTAQSQVQNANSEMEMNAGKKGKSQQTGKEFDRPKILSRIMSERELHNNRMPHWTSSIFLTRWA